MLLTTSEAARRCGVCPRTVLRWLTGGELVGVRTPGGHWRVDDSELANFLAGSVSLTAPGLRVVIVEDDPSEAQALATLIGLFAPGAQIERAEDGLAAGLLLGTSVPHVAFVDIEMPRLDGVDVIRRARRIQALEPTRFVVVSGRLSQARLGTLEELGIQDVLRKPVNPEVVRRLLADLGHDEVSEVGS